LRLVLQFEVAASMVKRDWVCGGLLDLNTSMVEGNLVNAVVAKCFSFKGLNFNEIKRS